ncbi:hypothetical protein P4U63_27580, partial [Bacillus paranthracis]|nr:hypothetical protein [Bacillus paranthracis]
IDTWLKSYEKVDGKEHYHGFYFKKMEVDVLSEVISYEVKINGNHFGNATSERYSPSEDGRIKVNFFEYNAYGSNHPVEGDKLQIWAVKKDRSTEKVIDTIIWN